jgi:hypothetical protein
MRKVPMKSIEQLLFLHKNPYYKFTAEEQAVIDDFLLKQQDDEPANSQKKSSKQSTKQTNVRVRNVIEKTIPQPEESGL